MRQLLQPVPQAILDTYPYIDIVWVSVGPDRWRGRLRDSTSVFAVADQSRFAGTYLYNDGVEERTESELQVFAGLERVLSKMRGDK